MIPALPDWHMFGFVDDPRNALAAARAAGRAVALATIVSRGGGGPRPVGAQMVFGPTGPSGYLSGGCLEADVAGHAAMVLSDGEPRRLVYGAGSPWPDIRLPCGGRIEVLVEAVPPTDAAIGELLRRTEARLPAVLRGDGWTRTCDDSADGPEVYAKAFDPVARLVVLGADPTALAITSLAAQAGFETILVRPHGPADPPPIAGVTYSRDDARLALARLGLDRWTAVAVATHDVMMDHEALLAALPSPAFYVGALGARRRLPERLEALRRGGVAPSDLARLRSPIGLDIGGESPWELAIAVLAEIIESRRASVFEDTADASGPPLVGAWARRAS